MQYSFLAAALMASSAMAFPLQNLFARSGQCKSAGVQIVNKRSSSATFYLYENDPSCNCNLDVSNVYKSQTVPAGQSVFLSLPTTWKGRVQRENYLPATWVEFQVQDAESQYHDMKAHGDVSLQQGTDGAATITAGDGSSSNGFNFDIVTDAPNDIIYDKPNGERAIKSTLGNWETSYSQAAIDYIDGKGLQGKVYASKANDVPDVASANNCMIATFY